MVMYPVQQCITPEIVAGCWAIKALFSCKQSIETQQHRHPIFIFQTIDKSMPKRARIYSNERPSEHRAKTKQKEQKCDAKPCVRICDHRVHTMGGRGDDEFEENC
jgi:hypothetical protein